MTIGGWVLFVFFIILIAGVGILIAIDADATKRALTILICILLIAGVFFGMRWYFKNTASGQRALIDQKSNLSNGMDRVINVYTANGDLIATYEGQIDIDTNDGGYVKFDFEGKRYIYYNALSKPLRKLNDILGGTK